jgi:hypothetical protein
MKKQCPVNQRTFEDITREIKQDVNLKYSGVQRDVLTILDALYLDRAEIILFSMDNVVIYHCFEVLILEFEKDSAEERYDRSVLVNLENFRTSMVSYHAWAAVGAAVIAMVFSQDIQDMSRRLLSSVF